MDEPEIASDQEEVPGGVAGKWVLLALILVSIIGSTAVVRFVQPRTGSEPVDVHDRPFGPATRGEQNSAPLIWRSNDDD